MLKKKRILVLGHTDLDGIMGAAAVEAAHPDDHVIVKFADYTNVDQMLLDALKKPTNKYDRIVLVDIAFNPNLEGDYDDIETRWLVKHHLPEAIYTYTKENGELVVLDHHPRALEVAASIYKNRLHEDSILETQDTNGIKRAGSELGARYFEKNFPSGLLGGVAFTSVITRLAAIAGAYDVFRKDEDFHLGSRLAMAQSLMWDDCYGFLTSLREVIGEAVNELTVNPDTVMSDFFWRAMFNGTMLGYYLKQAETMFEAEVDRAKSTAIQYGPHVTEIYSIFFESLVAEQIYLETGGVVVIRYAEKRGETKKVSLRRHGECLVNLSKVAKHFGGGGHPVASGLTLKGQAKIDDVIAIVLDELAALPKVAV